VVLADYRDIFKFLVRETYLVRVPVLGIAFDINDLGVFSGLTFIFLLILFWFTLEREEENLRMTFKLAEVHNCVREVYYYLSMGQVLTLPQREAPHKGHLWKYLPKAIYAAPLIVFCTIFVNDLMTSDWGRLLNNRATTFATVSSGIFLIIIFLLTVLCIHRSLRVDRLWRTTYARLNNENIEELKSIDLSAL
jgi:hypothetical protein